MTFQPASTTTLNGNLLLQNNNVKIQSGATFSGTGALIVDIASHLVVDNGATVSALIVNDGTLHTGGIDVIGTITVKDYSQASTGLLDMELVGTLPNQFDRLQATGIAQLDGRLLVDLDGGFNPALGATFDIVSTAFGVSGTFDVIDYQDLPAGKSFHVDYLANAVRLTVVSKPTLSADFDHDGDVDTTDYGIWRGAFGLNQLGDANGDNASNAADYILWRKQLGSVPGAGATVDGVIATVPEPTGIAIFACGVVFYVLAAPRHFKLG